LPVPILEIYDTGTGMNLEILKNNFLSVGSNSYWHSREGIEEWEIEYGSLDIIADHGIGTLSYFMIGDTIEIFTIYQKTSEFLHVNIDDLKDSILIQKTELKKFPQFSSTLDLSSPWDLRHGTCIRFKLNFKLNFKNLIQFFSSNILRLSTRLILNFNSAEYELPQIWHFRNFEDENVYSEKRFLTDSSNVLKPEYQDSDYYKNMYFEERSIYDDHPPSDKAVNENFINLPYIKGNVNINFWDEKSSACRISQRGILIKRAIDFINTNMKSKLLVSTFGFDIDVHGDFAFQLDAERTSIINSDYNKAIFLHLEEILVDQYFNLISKIESSIYFRCGGEFYHGITDIIFNHDDALKCFNSNFKRIFSEDLYKKYIKKVNAFDSAKLYMKGVLRCTPVSVKDLMALKDIILIIFKPNNLSKKGISRKIRGRTYIQQDKFEKRIGVKLSDDFIYLTDQNSPFILPLYENFEFVKEVENNFIYLFRLQIGKISDSIRNELTSLWTEEW
jgi:Histidine kinase-, DNA gyrase B-, and HSP90-like ATPase